ncbi:hypothetical protein D8I03_08010, partial [Campylobacter jejuni]|nr:hypothetical protein [Campylobacter jejuni]
KNKNLKIKNFSRKLAGYQFAQKFGFGVTKETIKHDKKIFIMQLVFLKKVDIMQNKNHKRQNHANRKF